MELKIKIKMNSINKILKDHGLEHDGPTERFLRDEVDRFCDPYIPFSGGSEVHMKDAKTYPNNHSIKYTAKYSHYHYVGKKAIGPSKPMGVSRKISNIPLNYQGAPKRGPKWEKRMMRDRGKEVIKDLENFIKNGGK